MSANQSPPHIAGPEVRVRPRTLRLRYLLAALVAAAAAIGVVSEMGRDPPAVATAPAAPVAVGGLTTADPRPEIDARQAAGAFHHDLGGLGPATVSSLPTVPAHPSINARITAERFHHR